jgi:hypothetical protein
MTRRDPSRDPSAGAVDTFLERLRPVERSPWPHRVLMEIECITDPVELEAVKRLIDERIAWLTK